MWGQFSFTFTCTTCVLSFMQISTDFTYRMGQNKLNKTLNYNSGYLAVIIRFLFNPPDALWLWHRRKRFVIVVYFKKAPQRDNRVKVSAFLRAGHKPCRSRTTVYAIKKCMDDGERVNRRADSGWQTVVNRCRSGQLAECHSRDCFEFCVPYEKCRNFHSIVSLRSQFEIHSNNKPFSSMSQSQSIGWVKQKLDNNSQKNQNCK